MNSQPETFRTNTPEFFYNPPFSEWVDWGASSHTVDLILEGSFDQQESNHLEQVLI